MSHRKNKIGKKEREKKYNDKPFILIDLPFLPWLDEIPTFEDFFIFPHCGNLIIDEK